TISGAMIGVAETVFSVTLVALTLASSQFGPRLIKKFMYVRLNQIVLGSYVATYLYCLLVLNAIKEGNEYSLIPSISVLIAIFAAIANIILLIVFITSNCNKHSSRQGYFRYFISYFQASRNALS